MDEIVVKKSGQGNLKARKIVYYVLGVLEVLLACRFVLKLLGANPGSTFVSLIYTVSGVFIAPFSAIFRSAETKGIETQSVLEPATIIAIIVYALIAYGIVMLIKIYKAPKDEVIRRV
jgi:glucan phosphoethanolaminetransferase (alkaline phosphatase superfamily)